jgi:hypothetical protein
VDSEAREPASLTEDVTVAATNWLQVGGIAQLIAAGATFALAAGTCYMAFKTRAVAKETHEVAIKTHEAAEATRQEAHATEALAEEMRNDRRLSFLPMLEVTSYVRDVHLTAGDTAGSVDRVSFRNAGHGPALGVVVLARDLANVGNWSITRMGHLRPEDGIKGINAEVREGGPTLYTPFEGIPGTPTDAGVGVVLLCSDVLGRRIRFGSYWRKLGNERDSRWEALPPEIASPAAHGFPMGWTSEPLVWG